MTLDSCGPTRRSLLKLFASATAGTFATIPALAATAWPEKPVRFVVPFPPGGGADATARIVTQELTKRLGVSALVDNRPGGNMFIGASEAERSAPDGYTFLMALDSIFTVNPYAYDKLPYDPAHGFEPVSLMTTQAQWYAARPGLNVHSMQELLAEVKKRPGQLNYGYGSPPGQLSAELLKSLTGAQMNMIAYKGAAAAVLAALRGEVDVIGADLAPMVQHVKAGKLVALGQTGVERSPLFPDVQTMQEQGLKGFEALAWFGAFAPAGTPKDIIAKMNSELVAVLGDQQVQAQILKLGYQAASSSPEALAARVKADAEKWGHLIRTANIKLS